jgi:hypothetical protein
MCTLDIEYVCVFIGSTLHEYAWRANNTTILMEPRIVLFSYYVEPLLVEVMCHIRRVTCVSFIFGE